MRILHKKNSVKGTSLNALDTNYDNKINDRSLKADFALSILFLVIGSVLIIAAENDFSSIVFTIFYAFIGMFLVFMLKGNKFEYRVFLLSYSLCVLVAGLSFTYSLSQFDVLMSTVDANSFYRLINEPYISFEHLNTKANSALSILIWMKLNSIREVLNIGGDGPGIYVLSNALSVAITGVFVTKIANEVFVNDVKRIRLAGTLFALCGMCWLFGSLLLRDSHALLLNTMGVWVIVKVLVSPNMRNFLLAIIVLGVSSTLMLYVREKSFYLFFLFALMGFGSWYFKSSFSPVKIILIFLAMAISLVAYEKIGSQLISATESANQKTENYTAGSSSTARSGSLGASLIVNQPFPIRLVIGSAYTLIYPIPTWGYFQIGLGEYLWIKGWQGVFIILSMPFVLYSAITLFKKQKRQSTLTPANMFLLFYFIISTMLVGITSLETRHQGQFLSAYLILAAMPKIVSYSNKRLLGRIRKIWFGAIIGGHVVWALLRM